MNTDTAILLLLVTVLFSVIGLSNNILHSYRERREEFMLYAISGMSPGQIRRMKLFEVTWVLGIGILVALLTAAVALPLMRYTLSGTNEYFISIRRFLTS